MSRHRLRPVAVASAALVCWVASARGGDSNGPVDYPREWGPDLCLGENGTKVLETSSSATSPDALVDGIAGEGHQWEPSWSNGLPASFTLRLPRVERWNKLVFTTRTSGEGVPRDCELWVGRTQADLHCERTFSLPKKSVQIADFEPVEGQLAKVVIKNTWRDEEVEVGEVALFLHAAAPPHPTEGQDSVEVRGGDKLLGELLGDEFPLKGRFFELKVPRANLVGAVLSDEGDRVFLATGEVLAGELGVEGLGVKLASGQTVDLPRSKVLTLAMRARKVEFPGKAEDLAAKGPVVVLDSGERWLARPTVRQLELETVVGRLSLGLDSIQSVTLGQGAEPLDLVVLKGGDSVHGYVLATTFAFKLDLGPEVSVPKAQVQRLVLSSDDSVEGGAPENQRVTLKTGDVLSGSLTAEKLSIRTSYATVDVPLASLDRLEAQDGGRLRASLRDGTTVVGRPAADSVPFQLDAGGGHIDLALERVRKVENWRLPPETLARVDSLVKRLDDPSWPKRDAAKTELARLGKLALPRLTKLVRAGTPEEKKGAQDILALIKIDER